MLAEPEGELHLQLAATEVVVRLSVSTVAVHSEQADAMWHVKACIVRYVEGWDFRQVNPWTQSFLHRRVLTEFVKWRIRQCSFVVSEKIRLYSLIYCIQDSKGFFVCLCTLWKTWSISIGGLSGRKRNIRELNLFKFRTGIWLTSFAAVCTAFQTRMSR